MNIYVPKHLRKIKIMEDLCSMIVEYSRKYEGAIGSFDDYQIYLKIDPVRRFIGLCLEEIYGDKVKSGTMDRDEYENILEYLTRLFYSVKGTYNVIQYTKRYLGLEFIDILYTSRILNFTLQKIVGNDISIFDEYFREFLFNLLYIEKLEYSIRGLKQNIEEDLDFYGSLGIMTYKRFTINDEIEQDDL